MPGRITLEEWDLRYEQLQRAGICRPQAVAIGGRPDYGGPLSRHVADGDQRLLKLRYDNSAAALRLWNFLLTEEDRLRQAQRRSSYRESRAQVIAHWKGKSSAKSSGKSSIFPFWRLKYRP